MARTTLSLRAAPCRVPPVRADLLLCAVQRAGARKTDVAAPAILTTSEEEGDATFSSASARARARAEWGGGRVGRPGCARAIARSVAAHARLHGGWARVRVPGRRARRRQRPAGHAQVVCQLGRRHGQGIFRMDHGSRGGGRSRSRTRRRTTRLASCSPAATAPFTCNPAPKSSSSAATTCDRKWDARWLPKPGTGSLRSQRTIRSRSR